LGKQFAQLHILLALAAVTALAVAGRSGRRHSWLLWVREAAVDEVASSNIGSGLTVGVLGTDVAWKR
jgi:hypothetical protein